MAKVYERYLKLLKAWPVHPENPEPFRALPEYIRKRGQIAFTARGELIGNSKDCDKSLQSLERIVKNHWLQTYPQSRQIGALGLFADECKLALSEEFIKSQETSVLEKTISNIIYTIRSTFSSKKT